MRPPIQLLRKYSLFSQQVNLPAVNKQQRSTTLSDENQAMHVQQMTDRGLFYVCKGIVKHHNDAQTVNLSFGFNHYHSGTYV